MLEWQPIETAPKGDDDGFLPYYGALIVYAPDYGRGAVIVASRDEDGVWHEATDHNGYEPGHEVKPTHWMPWPKPPAPSQATRQT